MTDMDLDRLKREFDRDRLERLAEAEGLPVRNHRMACPAGCAEDKRRVSLGEESGVGLWHCKGCDARGTAIDLLMHTRKAAASEAVRLLKDLVGHLPAPRVKPDVRKKDGKALFAKLAPTDKLGEEYLTSRGLGEAVAAGLVRFNIGTARDDWLDRKAREGYRVAVPLLDAAGEIVSFQVRSIGCADPSKLSLYTVGTEGLAFGQTGVARTAARVFLTEGMGDTLALLLTGVCTVGFDGEGKVRSAPSFLGHAKGREFVLCPQNDKHEKSQKAFAALEKTLRKAHAVVRTLVTPEAYKDPAEWLEDVGLDAFRAAVHSFESSPVAPPVEPEPEPAADLPEEKELRALTDTGNAEKLVRMYGIDLRYCGPHHAWYVWDERRWEMDRRQAVDGMGKEAILDLKRIADESGDSQLWAHADESESSRSRAAMLKLARSEPGMPVLPEQFDADPWLFNVENGTIDLRTGELRPHRRQDLLTKVAPVRFDPSAPAPLWERFLADVQPDPAILAFLQRFFGYAMTGVIREHVFPINYGQGRNGKGTCVDTIRHVLGDYGKTAPTELLMAKNGETHPTERTILWNTRFVSAEETREGRTLDVALVKTITGGDRISARFMRADFFEFEPTHKIMLSTNHKPGIKDNSEAIWQRVLLIPWNVYIPPERRDGDLKEKLKGEAPGILAWMVRGCLEWQRVGLKPPEAVVAATKDYRDSSDVMGDFFDERCVVGPAFKVKSSRLLEEYNEWLKPLGFPPVNSVVFAERLKAREFESKKTDGCIHWLGIGLRGHQDQRSREAARLGERDEPEGAAA